jgi:hypothetical protein
MVFIKMLSVKKKLYYLLFLIIITLLFEGCLIHGFDKNGTFPLQLNVETVLENKKVKFKIKESHIELKNYYLNNIRITTSNNYCDERYKKGLILWQYQTDLPQEKISVLSKIAYGDKGESQILRKNTLYMVDVSINKIEGLKIGRYGKGGGVFILTDRGKILSGYNYDDVNKLCRKYGKKL